MAKYRIKKDWIAGHIWWSAYRVFWFGEFFIGHMSNESAEDCENQLRKKLETKKSQVVKELEL